jgi:hypothetical protein
VSVQTVKIPTTLNGRAVVVLVSVDYHGLAHQLVGKADRNKSHRSRVCAGAVEVKLLTGAA